MGDERRKKVTDESQSKRREDVEVVTVKVKWIKIKEKPGSPAHKKVYFHGEAEAADFYGYFSVPPNSEFAEDPAHDPDKLKWLKRLLESNFSDESSPDVNVMPSNEPTPVGYGWMDRFNNGMPESSPSCAEGDPEHVLVVNVTPVDRTP